MVQDPFPDPGPDDEELEGFPSAEDGPGLGQGLYVTLPAEQLTLSGFAQGGEADTMAPDTMAPGALLAAVVDTVTGEDGSGLAGCSDDQLLGIISAARRLESRSAWTLMAAVGEFARRANLTLTGGPALGPDPPPGTRPQDYLHRLGIDMAPVTRGHCDHARAEAGYRPSSKLRHLVRARSARCTAPGCGRPAARCDLDHTVPWDQGGITCECGLAPPCLS